MLMDEKKWKIEFRYYEKPASGYILPKLGQGWEIHYGADTPDTLHYHNLFEFGYCYHGSGTLTISDQEHRYHDNCYTAIPANIPHTTESDPGSICKWEFLFVDMASFIRNEMKGLHMSPEDLLSVVDAHGTMKTMEHHSRMGTLIRLMIEECRGSGEYYEESLKGYLRAVVIELIRLSEERRLRSLGSRYERYIAHTLDYIGKHFHEDLSIEDLAKVSGLSESHFRRAFEESTNMRPVEYLNMIRIEAACRMLLKEDLAMTDVAYRVGFQTSSSFNRNFKRLTGTTPLQWKLRAIREGGIKKGLNIRAMKGWEVEDWINSANPRKNATDTGARGRE